VKKVGGPVRVIVIGAGVGGLTLANGLREVGIEVVVAERDGPEGRPQGISVHLDDRGTTALRDCLPPAAAALVRATLGGPRDRALTLAEVGGELVVDGALPLDGTAGRTRPGRPAHRPLLRAVLLAGLGDAVRFGREFTGFDQRPDGTVRARFADGTTETGDVLVGADGIGSPVRRQHRPHVRVLDTGKRMLMGTTPLRAAAGTGLPDLIGDAAARAQVRGTTVVLGALRFGEPPAVARDRLLPGLHSPAVTDAEDYLMWALPTTREAAGPAGSPAAVWRRARELTADLPTTLRRVVDAAWPELTVALRIGLVPPAPPSAAAPVTLIGDAVHAAPGFGANLALQDARRLRDALARADRGEQDLLTAIGEAEEAVRHLSPAPAR
jgi:2-polyprenyl-6-methoxyphenol hydroxylase-like FAD-dependent oxidoreductase